MILIANKEIELSVISLVKNRIKITLTYIIMPIAITQMVTQGINTWPYWIIISIYTIIMFIALILTINNILKSIIFSIEIENDTVTITFLHSSFEWIRTPEPINCNLEYICNVKGVLKGIYGFDSCIKITFNEYVKSIWGIKEKSRSLLIVTEFFNSLAGARLYLVPLWNLAVEELASVPLFDSKY